MMSINQADKASILRGISPKNADPGNVRSIGWPNRAFTAGMEVVIATDKTKKKLEKALIFEGNKGILTIPITATIADDIISQKLSILSICLNSKIPLGYPLKDENIPYFYQIYANIFTTGGRIFLGDVLNLKRENLTVQNWGF